MRTFGSPEFLFIVYALRWTLTLTLVAFIGGGMMGIVLALLRISRFKALRIAVSFYMQVIQGLPLLIMMFLCYYAPALVGVELGALTAAAIALTIHSSAFLGAIWESALRAIPKAQWESADALALTPYKTLRFVIAPQVRFKGQPGEQATMFFLDPSGNALEFKAFADDAMVFAK